MTDPVLSVRHLATSFYTDTGIARAVDGVSFDLDRGETLALVGESGSGKSVTALSLLRLIEPPGEIHRQSEAWFEGRDLMKLPSPELQTVRGRRIAMIFQEPGAALNPVLTVGAQIREVLKVHLGLDRKRAKERVRALLEQVGLPHPDRHARQYPHELSGGMQQRAMIAMALACEPTVLIADEPTTALDVTIQAQILDTLRRLREAYNLSILLITHDLGIVAGIADRVAVMYGGQIVESGSVHSIFQQPQHPYTVGLLEAIPRVDTGHDWMRSIPGAVPSATDWPGGCRFHPRCGLAWDRCRSSLPRHVPVEGGTLRCWLHVEPHRRETR